MHFAFQNFTSNCNNAEFIPTTDDLRTIFVDEHNTRRITAALGQVNGVFAGKSATRMAEMVCKLILIFFK